MGRGVTLHLEVYLPFRGAPRWVGEEEVPAGLTAGDLPVHLGVVEPELAVLVNGRFVNPATPLVSGDRVAILRQAEGG